MNISIGDIVRLDKKGGSPFEGVIYEIGNYFLIPGRFVDEGVWTLRIKSVRGSYCIKTVNSLNYEDYTEIEKIGIVENFDPSEGKQDKTIDISKIKLNNNVKVISRKLLPRTDYSGKEYKIFVKTKKNWFTLLRTTDKMAFYDGGRCSLSSVTDVKS
jgi:hypothetical protein